MNCDPHPLGFDPGSLPMPTLAVLFDALSTLQNVTAGLMEGGMFEQDGEPSRPAYHMMDNLRDKFGSELCSIKEEIEKRNCDSEADAAAKFNILLMAAAWSGERPCEIVANLAKSVSDIEWEQRFGRTAKPVRMTGGQRNG